MPLMAYARTGAIIMPGKQMVSNKKVPYLYGTFFIRRVNEYYFTHHYIAVFTAFLFWFSTFPGYSSKAFSRQSIASFRSVRFST